MSKGTKIKRQKILPSSVKAKCLLFLSKLIGIGFVGLALCGWAALMSWSVTDPSLSRDSDAATTNFIGPFGAQFADLSFQLIGFAAIFALLPLAALGIHFWRLKFPKFLKLRLMLWPLAIGAIAASLAYFQKPESLNINFELGGLIGNSILQNTTYFLSAFDIAQSKILALIGFILLGGLLLFFSISVRFRDIYNCFKPDRAEKSKHLGWWARFKQNRKLKKLRDNAPRRWWRSSDQEKIKADQKPQMAQGVAKAQSQGQMVPKPPARPIDPRPGANGRAAPARPVVNVRPMPPQPQRPVMAPSIAPAAPVRPQQPIQQLMQQPIKQPQQPQIAASGGLNAGVANVAAVGTGAIAATAAIMGATALKAAPEQSEKAPQEKPTHAQPLASKDLPEIDVPDLNQPIMAYEDPLSAPKTPPKLEAANEFLDEGHDDEDQLASDLDVLDQVGALGKTDELAASETDDQEDEADELYEQEAQKQAEDTPTIFGMNFDEDDDESKTDHEDPEETTAWGLSDDTDAEDEISRDTVDELNDENEALDPFSVDHLYEEKDEDQADTDTDDISRDIDELDDETTFNEDLIEEGTALNGAENNEEDNEEERRETNIIFGNRPASSSTDEPADLFNQTDAKQTPLKQTAFSFLESAAELNKGSDDFELPSIDLLNPGPSTHQFANISEENLREQAAQLESVLLDFGVKGQIINVRPGPVVTLFELEPARGTKTSRVVGLASDIARSMSAFSARIAVIPGRNALGIELPNKERETVYLREIIEQELTKENKETLPLVLGKTIDGTGIVADLARMPHLLIAGTTGSGKSVGINTMIISLLYRMSPEECKLIMIDPKMLELSIYDGIPHLLTPVVTDPKKALSALKWTVREMEDRYQKMSKTGVRNIAGFNEKVKEAKEKGEELVRTVQTGFDQDSGEAIYEHETLEYEPMPYIVVVIDEMADLMMVAGKEIEAAVQRLAQMARASGIHLITATQRPSVDVITGTIKANFPTRISFQVTSKVDSRTILGEQGAEQLLGAGDMLYMPGGNRMTRVHGAFISDEEVENITNHLRSQGIPQYLDSVVQDEEEELDEGASRGSTDELYDEAVAIVRRDQKASISYIQRRLSIGYNRAATLVECMEEQGIIGPADRSGKRDILID